MFRRCEFFKASDVKFSSLSLLLVVACVGFAPLAQADDAMIEEGRQIAFDRKKGNCLSCHSIAGGEVPGTISVPLVAMQARFPDKEVLRQNVWDQTQFRPHAMMPPFGKHQILTEEEIDKIVEFIHTL